MCKLFISTGLLLSTATAAIAQIQPGAPGVEQHYVTVKKERRDINPDELAEKQTAQLTSQLSLSPEQTARVRAAVLVQYQEQMAMHKRHIGPTNPATLQEEGRAISAKFAEQMQATLTPEQYERWLMNKERFRKYRAQAEAAGKTNGQPVPVERP